MKRGTLAGLFMMLSLAISVFIVKYQVLAVHDHVDALNRQILDQRENIHLLEAEWAHLTEPHRLQRLAKYHLADQLCFPLRVIAIHEKLHGQLLSQALKDPMPLKAASLKEWYTKAKERKSPAQSKKGG